MAKSVPSDTFGFDDTVKKNEASYLLSYTPLPSQAEANQGIEDPADKKIPFAITLTTTFIICSAVWFGIAFAIIKLLNR